MRLKFLDGNKEEQTNNYKKLEFSQHSTLPVVKRKIDLVDVILRLSEALVCFRASGDNFLRSITSAIVNKNDGKRKK